MGADWVLLNMFKPEVACEVGVCPKTNCLAWESEGALLAGKEFTGAGFDPLAEVAAENKDAVKVLVVLLLLEVGGAREGLVALSVLTVVLVLLAPNAENRELAAEDVEFIWNAKDEEAGG